MTSKASAVIICPFCSAPAPGLYELPTRIVRTHQRVRPACYFCYIRMSGIKPTRSRLVADVERPGARSAR